MATDETEPKPYYIDPTRTDLPGTGIYVRAQSRGSWDSIDIAHLEEDSLHRWLLSRGGSNPWAESVVLRILGHPAR